MSFPPLNAPVKISYRLQGSLSTNTLTVLESARDKQLAVLEAEKKALESRSELLALAKRRIRVLIDHETAIESALDKCQTGPRYLQVAAMRDFVIRSWQNLHDRGLVDLIAVCVLPNHVQVIAQAPEGENTLSMAPVMGAHFMYTTHKAIQLFPGLSNELWEEYHHRRIRSGMLGQELNDLMNRPVAAGCVKVRSKWAGTYVNPEYRKLARRRAA